MADNNKKVLVVEDEQDLREAVTMALYGVASGGWRRGA